VQTETLFDDNAILIGIGANLASPLHGPPVRSCIAAVAAVAEADIAVHRVSPWYESAPVPPSDQPRYVNGVAAIGTELTPDRLLARLHEIEAAFGRVRRKRNEARILDLDLLAYGRQIAAPPACPILPHPRIVERAFVLFPLRDIVPDWRHPVDGRSIDGMVAALAPGQDTRRLRPSSL